MSIKKDSKSLGYKIQKVDEKFYKKYLIEYMEELDPETVKDARKIYEKCEIYIKHFIKNNIFLDDPLEFFKLLEHKRYNSLGLPPFSTNNQNKRVKLTDLEDYYLNLYKELKKKFPNFQKLSEYLYQFQLQNLRDKNEIIERITKIRSIKAPATREKMILIYGERLGNLRWESYLDKQRNKKSNRKNIDKRKITLDNMVKKWGEKLGTKFFNQYCETQKHAGCSLDYFILKYGEKTGEEKYKEICNKKAITLENMQRIYGIKEGEEKWKEFINRKKNFYSNISQEIFNFIALKFPEYKFLYGENEISLQEDGNVYFYDCFICELNLVIEFNGDIWHANPKIFREFDCPNPHKKNLTSKDIWEYDKKKNALVSKVGYDLLILWESDFKEDKEKFLEDIIAKIKERVENENRRNN